MATVQFDQALADQMVERAIVFCADKKFNGDSKQALLALRQGRCDVCGYLSNSLVRQVGEYLGQVDRTVKAVFEFVAEKSSVRPQTGESANGGRKTGINLIAWVDRKSAALNALGATLETVLSESKRKIGCKNAGPACYTLSVQMVEDKDVKDRRGYGVIVNSAYIHSVQVWGREESFGPVVSRRSLEQELPASLDPEYAPEETLFEPALAIEKIPENERGAFEYRLRELKVALIRKIISDQLAYINIAKEWFTIADLVDIWKRKIGYGKIGGKSAGMLLAARILKEIADESVRESLSTPDSYFMGSDVMYIFMAMNGLMHYNNQKYKSEEQIRAEYPQIREDFQAGGLPPEVRHKLETMLAAIGPSPIIVRSSSQLEDNFGTSFAGKYDSHFCPNQGTPEENLRELIRAIALTFASTFKPDALLYRRSRSLQDYDERMAILFQVVQGERFGRYYLPQGAGVAFSRNLYRWSPQIRRDAGFARLVWGLGTRAVERVGNDYPRPVALSHPTLQPDDSAEAIQRYSQQYVDLIDLEDNRFKTLPVHQVLNPNYPALRFVAQLLQDDYFITPRSRVPEADAHRLSITFDGLLRRTQFPVILSKMLRLLEENYHAAVDMEFTVRVADPFALQPKAEISILQCRPQSRLQAAKVVAIPKELTTKEIIFSTRFMVPQGYVPNIQHVVFVTPEGYYALQTAAERAELSRLICQLNAILKEKSFICVGPGRWGTTNTDLGVFVCYSDICHAAALVELAGKGIGPAPEPSLGTHFFQDLMEAQIYPIAVSFDDEATRFNRDFFYQTPNRIAEYIHTKDSLVNCLRLIEVASFQAESHLELIMDDEKGQAVAFLAANY